jgi:hypothetical protein
MIKSLKDVARDFCGVRSRKRKKREKKETNKKFGEFFPVSPKAFLQAGALLGISSMFLPSEYKNPPSHRPIDGARNARGIGN